MKTLVLDVDKEDFFVTDIEPELSEYYRLLNCDLIDIVARCIGGKWFDIICDDEGLLTQRKLSAVNKKYEPMLVGNLMFVHHDDEGNTVGIDDEEILHIMNNIQFMGTRRYPDGYPMLVNCNFFEE